MQIELDSTDCHTTDSKQRSTCLAHLRVLRSMASLLAALVERDSTIKQIESEMALVARGNDEVLTALNAKYERVKRLLCMLQVRRNPALPVSAHFRFLCRQAHYQRTLCVCLFAAQGF